MEHEVFRKIENEKPIQLYSLWEDKQTGNIYVLTPTSTNHSRYLCRNLLKPDFIWLGSAKTMQEATKGLTYFDGMIQVSNKPIENFI